MREGIGARPAFGLRGIVAVPHLFPGDQDGALIRHAQGLGRVEIEAVIEFTDLVDMIAAGLEVELAQQVEAGVDVLIQVVHLREVLRAGEHDFLSVQHQVVRTFIDAVQFVEVIFKFRLSVEKVPHIFPVHQVPALAENEISEAGDGGCLAKHVALRRSPDLGAYAGVMHVIFGYRLAIARGVLDRGGGKRLLFFSAFRPGVLFNDSGTGQEIIASVLHEEMGIPEIKGRYFFVEHFGGENGVGLFFDESDTSVCRFGEALPLQIRLGGGIDQVQGAVFLYSGSGAAAAADFIFLIRDQGDGQHVPVHEVICREMAPMHDPTLGFVGIVLEK